MAEENVKTKKKAQTDEILWKDRKRIFGLPISFTRYFVTNERLYTKVGFWRTETNEILLYRILDIKLVRSFGQKIFGVGTITLFSADRSHGTLEVKNIRKPEEVNRFLSRITEQQREKKNIIGREVYGAAAGMMGQSAADHSFVDIDGDGIPD